MAALLRLVIVLFVAALSSGVAHAHQQGDESCEQADDDCTHENGEESPACPEDLCGPAHHCGCCSPLVVTCTTSARVIAATGREIVRPCAPATLASSGVRSRIERPPRG